MQCATFAPNLVAIEFREAGQWLRPVSGRSEGLARSLRSQIQQQSAPGSGREGDGTEMAADSLDDYIASAAKALSLTIEDSWRPAVRANLEVSLRLARLVDEFPFADDAEPASVFSA